MRSPSLFGKTPRALSSRFAPLAELFSEVLRQPQSGLDLSGGFATLVGRVLAEKAKAMVWCLSEASLQMKAEVIAAAACMNISLDEGHGRLHCRYRCVSKDFCFSCGYIGQSWHPDLGCKFLRKCKFILRDAAHSARRILGRGFGVDPVLEKKPWFVRAFEAFVLAS